MRVVVIDRIGGRPLELDASQVVVTNDEGTPVVVALEYGPRGSIKASHAADADFNQTLRAVGFGRHQVVTETIGTPPPPPGASRIIGPGLPT
jgi:hypothetical protein